MVAGIEPSIGVGFIAAMYGVKAVYGDGTEDEGDAIKSNRKTHLDGAVLKRAEGFLGRILKLLRNR